MRSFILMSAVLAGLVLNNSGQAGRFYTEDGQYFWEYDHTEKKAGVYSTNPSNLYTAVRYIQTRGKWDKEKNQLEVLFQGDNVRDKGERMVSKMSLSCGVVDDWDDGKRLEVLVKEPKQEERWNHYIKLSQMEGVVEIVDNYFERSIASSVVKEPNGTTRKLSADEQKQGYIFPEGFELLPMVERKPIISADSVMFIKEPGEKNIKPEKK